MSGMMVLRPYKQTLPAVISWELLLPVSELSSATQNSTHYLEQTDDVFENPIIYI